VEAARAVAVRAVVADEVLALVGDLRDEGVDEVERRERDLLRARADEEPAVGPLAEARVGQGRPRDVAGEPREALALVGRTFCSA
jgi:hypothetical protein